MLRQRANNRNRSYYHETDKEPAESFAVQEMQKEWTETDSGDVFQLPPRNETHRLRGRKTRAKQRRKKKKVPLVRILLIIFLLLVAAILTYPLWIDKLI